MIEPSNLQELERELDRRRRDDPLALTYRPIEKQIELHRSRKNLTIAVGGNRCQPAETTVWRASGVPTTLGALAEGDEILGLPATGKRNTVAVGVTRTRSFVEGALAVTTKRGYRTEGTVDHPIWACPPKEPGWHGGRMPNTRLARWVELQSLQLGWYVQMAFGPFTAWRGTVDETAYFHGLMEGDGGLYGDYGVMKFFGHDEETLSSWVEDYLDRHEVNHSRFQRSPHGISVEWCNLDFKRSYQQWTPQWSPEEMAGYIRGIFDAEGCVTDHELVCVGVDLELGRKLQRWLLLFGIKASYREYAPALQWRRPSASYRLTVSGSSVRRYREAIGFGEGRKAQKLAALAVRSHDAHHLWWDRITSVEKTGERTIVGITTTTGAYFSDGVLSKNSGKSWSSVAETQYYCLGREVWAEVPKPPVMVWYVMPSLPMFRRAIRPIMRKLIPEKEVRRFYWRDGIIEYRNGSELHILSADMRQKRVQGASIDLAVLDETPEQDIFDEAQARTMDRHGRIILAFAPIDVSVAWVRDNYYIPWTLGDKPGIDVVHFPTGDRDGHSLVPWFSDADIKDAEERWPDPATRASRIYGEFITRSGRVYNFDPETHLVQPFEVPDTFARWMLIDPQYHRFASLYFAADPEGTYYITDEYFSQDESLAHRAERLSSIVGKRDRPIPAYVDSANPQDTAELNWHFQRLGASIAAIPLPFAKKIDSMVLNVHSMLEPSPERAYRHAKNEAPLYGAPRLLFFNTLCSTWSLPDGKDFVASRLLWEMNHLSWGKSGKPDKDTADGGDACDCYDDQTEVLTREGWKQFANVRAGVTGDEFATVDLCTDELVYQPAIEKIERQHTGDMIQLLGERLDILVTPKHRMVVSQPPKPGRPNKHRKVVIPAEELTQKHRIKLTASWRGRRTKVVVLPASQMLCGKEIEPERHLDTGDWAAFLGWYTAEGCRTSSVSRTQKNRWREVTISQKSGPKKDEIMRLSRCLPWHFHEIEDGIVFTSKQLYEAVGACGDGAFNKHVPQWIKDSSPKTIQRFVDAAVAGDGWTANGTPRYATVSQKLADDMQELFLKLGWSTRVTVIPAKPWSIEGRSGMAQKQYWVYAKTRVASSLERVTAKGKHVSLIQRVPYSGTVYCVSVPNTTLICRRGGISFIAGNCLSYGCTVRTAGLAEPVLETWKSGLSYSDLLTWSLIERSDHKDKRIRED